MTWKVSKGRKNQHNNNNKSLQFSHANSLFKIKIIFQNNFFIIQPCSKHFACCTFSDNVLFNIDVRENILPCTKLPEIILENALSQAIFNRIEGRQCL